MHTSVLLTESVEALAIQPDGRYVDLTFGRGGHSRAILQQLSAEGRLLGFDRDPQAIRAGQQLVAEDARFELVRRPFSALAQVLAEKGWLGQVDGILADLGVSSPQLDDASRGFSFMRDGPLDMRMDPEQGLSAADWLLAASEAEIADVLWQYGEERQSRRIARAIKLQCQEAPITSTAQLAKLIEKTAPSRDWRKHAATRSFQAIRIAVNAEMTELDLLLPQSLTALKPGGRLAVISFHSLEDRKVKHFIRLQQQGPEQPRHLPIVKPFSPQLKALGKVLPPAEEIADNPRSRSAVLRVALRC